MIKKLFLNNKIILILILLNAVIIFMLGFDWSEKVKNLLTNLDNIITGLFIVEMIIKLRAYGIKTYFLSNWNKFDFILIVLSVPALIAFLFNIEFSSISFLLVFRTLRIFKSFRFLKFVPGIDNMLKGILRAFKASIVFLIGFTIYIFIIGTCSFYFFNSSGSAYFKNPLISLYSIFKVFTIEGWYTMPEQITMGYSATSSFFTNLYFIFILITGGIFGFSLVNSIFVDAMVSDNNDALEKKIDQLDKKLTELINSNKI